MPICQTEGTMQRPRVERYKNDIEEVWTQIWDKILQEDTEK